jgi:hypothetical protein
LPANVDFAQVLIQQARELYAQDLMAMPDHPEKDEWQQTEFWNYTRST